MPWSSSPSRRYRKKQPRRHPFKKRRSTRSITDSLNFRPNILGCNRNSKDRHLPKKRIFQKRLRFNPVRPAVATAMPFSGEHFADMMKAQVNRRLDIYSARLNLFANQRSQLEKIMLLQFTQMRPRMSGQFMQEGGDGTKSPLIAQRNIDDLAEKTSIRRTISQIRWDASTRECFS